MKLVLIMYSGSDPQLVPELLERNGAEGYTEVGRGQGAGTSGRREGTRAWPGNASVWFSIVPADRAQSLMDALRTASGELATGERLHAALMPTDAFF